jgi:hypothetical protein
LKVVWKLQKRPLHQKRGIAAMVCGAGFCEGLDWCDDNNNGDDDWHVLVC